MQKFIFEYEQKCAPHTADSRTSGNPQVYKASTVYQQKYGKRFQYPMKPNYQPARQFYTPPRPTASKPQPKPETIDDDGSIRSGHINYMNTPIANDYSGKRPAPQNGLPPKFQRQFRIATWVAENETTPVDASDVNVFG